MVEEVKTSFVFTTFFNKFDREEPLFFAFFAAGAALCSCGRFVEPFALCVTAEKSFSEHASQ